MRPGGGGGGEAPECCLRKRQSARAHAWQVQLRNSEHKPAEQTTVEGPFSAAGDGALIRHCWVCAAAAGSSKAIEGYKGSRLRARCRLQ